MSKEYKIGFIGAGVMGKAIIKRIIDSGFVLPQNLMASEISETAAQKASEELQIKVTTSNKELTKNCDFIFLCTKPFVIKNVIEDIKDVLTAGKVIVSIAAGVSTETIESLINTELSVIRTMPNTPILMGEGMTAVCKGKYTKDEEIAFVKELFSQTGRCLEIEEKYINTVTAISGSGPAFIYLMIEALADGGLKLGLPKKVATELAAQTAIGAAKMVIESGKHPSVLKDEVSTPAGCTVAGLSVMESEGIRSALIKTVQETAKVASGLG